MISQVYLLTCWKWLSANSFKRIIVGGRSTNYIASISENANWQYFSKHDLQRFWKVYFAIFWKTWADIIYLVVRRFISWPFKHWGRFSSFLWFPVFYFLKAGHVRNILKPTWYQIERSARILETKKTDLETNRKRSNVAPTHLRIKCGRRLGQADYDHPPSHILTKLNTYWKRNGNVKATPAVGGGQWAVAQ